MAEESQAPNTYIDTNGPKPRVEFGKTLAFYVELAERLEVIDKQFVECEVKILGRSEPTNREHLINESKKDIAEPGYIERLDDVAVRIHASVCSLANIVGRLNDVI